LGGRKPKLRLERTLQMMRAHSRPLPKEVESDALVAKISDVQVDVILCALDRTT
jgi:hypothetical protein